MVRAMSMMDVDEATPSTDHQGESGSQQVDNAFEITDTQPLKSSQDDEEFEEEEDAVWGRLVHTERSSLYQPPPPQNGASRRAGRANPEIGAVDVKGDLFKIGRGDFMDLQVRDVSVSVEHCILERQGDTVFISDNQSSNGTYVLGKRLKRNQRKELKNGDVFSLVRSRPSSAVQEWYEFCFEKLITSSQHEDEMNRLRFAQRVSHGEGPQAGGALSQAIMVASAGGDSGIAAAMQCEEFVTKYEILNKLGEGGHAKVYRVRSLRDRRAYALKVVDKRQFANNRHARSLKDLMNEALIMRSLNHPGIIQLVDIFSTDRTLLLIMELVHGGELFDRLVNKGSYPQAKARALIKNILLAVAYLHDLDIVHRDLKPENILMTSVESDVDIKLADFGLAKQENKGRRTLCGTIGYAAPEVLRREQSELGLGTYGKEADMWSLGVTAYIILTSIPPFPSDSGSHDFHLAALKRAPEFLAFPADLRNFILGMLEVDGKKRLTVHQALRHPWLRDSLSDSGPMPMPRQPASSASKNKVSAATAQTGNPPAPISVIIPPCPPPHPLHDRSNVPETDDEDITGTSKRKIDSSTAAQGRLKLVKIRSDESLL
mmetsp:Transcript_19434/g.38077  ORF Transcript_19434/g.38077 Transcript_19434/m.38077 type:complete len:602 (+) Transcript_19434:532-2337(+)|eukprot:CAMPEP_0171572824 /NCGR_PEP_ID=MMETSP0961-20121227/4381_1 /TAXON_ID=87120 /ORGANISM="Aurantiochytrium limacinum, Strain ATCCMYA-1381" /LENGTH=601 /DNA_ID=CAMNT_0012127801 /DNA_START=461 /DNA_END=2266 /DNA_ORIENTATION=+